MHAHAKHLSQHHPPISKAPAAFVVIDITENCHVNNCLWNGWLNVFILVLLTSINNIRLWLEMLSLASVLRVFAAMLEWIIGERFWLLFTCNLFIGTSTESWSNFVLFQLFLCFYLYANLFSFAFISSFYLFFYFPPPAVLSLLDVFIGILSWLWITESKTFLPDHWCQVHFFSSATNSQQ